MGGDTAEELDYHDTVNFWLPLVLLFVLGLSFLLLTLAFRSIVVPATAIGMNLLSVGAAYGLLVLVFQEGIGNELLGLREAETIDAWVPLFLFAVLFGLSMDYQVFLLSRIRERYTQTGDTDAAISFGIGSTARLITGAALIIIAVFWGFAMGDTIAFQQMGFGIAVALLIDATIVRSVLVPATMKLLGERNWYLPAWLTWLPDVHVEGAEPPPADCPSADARRKRMSSARTAPENRPVVDGRPVMDAVDGDRHRRDLGRRPAAQRVRTRSGLGIGAGPPPGSRVHGMVLGRSRHARLLVGDGQAAGSRDGSPSGSG